MSFIKKFNEKWNEIGFVQRLKKYNLLYTFLVCFILFIIVNFIFALIAYGADGVLNLYFSRADYVLSGLFGGFVSPPVINVMTAGTIASAYPPFTPSVAILTINYLVAPLFVAIIAGRLGRSRKVALASLFLTAISSAIIVMLISLGDGVFLSPLTLFIYYVTGEGYDPVLTETVSNIFPVLGGIFSAIFFGFFTLLVHKSE